MTSKEHKWPVYSPELINGDPINWKEVPSVEKIWGFEGGYSIFSNHSPFRIDINGRRYGNIAFTYEALRFEPYGINEFLRRIPAGQSHRIGPDDYTPGGWGGDEVGVMKKLLHLKFDSECYPQNAKLLLETCDKLLVAVDEPDCMMNGITWGVDKVGRGNNELGLILMEVREELEDRLMLADKDASDQQWFEGKNSVVLLPVA